VRDTAGILYPEFSYIVLSLHSLVHRFLVLLLFLMRLLSHCHKFGVRKLA